MDPDDRPIRPCIVKTEAKEIKKSGSKEPERLRKGGRKLPTILQTGFFGLSSHVHYPH